MNVLGRADPAPAKAEKFCNGGLMSATTEGGFEGPLPSFIKPDGFQCYRRGGCDREAHCEGEGECLGVDPPLANALNHNRFDQIAEIERLGVDPPLANALSRNRFDQIAELVRALTYTEMIEFAGGLWSLRGEGEVSSESLPKILHAWAMEASNCAINNDRALPAGECDFGTAKKFQPIDTAPKDRPILAFMLGRWRIARWTPNRPHKRPIPFWSADDLRVTVSRAHQPKWWAELPPSPPEA
jgi:hypothetical protein